MSSTTTFFGGLGEKNGVVVLLFSEEKGISQGVVTLAAQARRALTRKLEPLFNQAQQSTFKKLLVFALKPIKHLLLFSSLCVYCKDFATFQPMPRVARHTTQPCGSPLLALLVALSCRYIREIRLSQALPVNLLLQLLLRHFAVVREPRSPASC